MELLLIWLQVFSPSELRGLRVRERAALQALMQRDSTGQKVDSFLVALGFWRASWEKGYVGPRYRLRRLVVEGDSGAEKLVSRYFRRSWEGEVLRAGALDALLEEALYEVGKAGYLYASAEWSRLDCDAGGDCVGYVRVFLGERVVLDTVFIRGRWPAPLSAFYRVTGVWPKRPLSREAWEKLPMRLARSPYATVVDTPRLWLFPGLAWAEVRVRPQQNSRIEGALGLASDPLKVGKVQLVGDLKAQLSSPLRLGENLQVTYSQLVGGSQRLDLRLALPYLFRGLVGMEGYFNLLRQDTSFLFREGGVEFSYRLTAVHTFLGGVRVASSRLLSTAPYRQRVWPPPPNLDYRRRGVRLGWRMDSRDHPLSPSTGWFVEVVGSRGVRGYLPNPGLPALDYSRLPQSSPFQEGQVTLGRYWPIGRRLTLWTQAMGYRYWVESFFENELRRAGGPKDLRGFAENSLPTYEFGQATLELRLRMGDEDYLAAFGEGGLIGLYPDRRRTFQTVGFALQAQLSVGLLRLTFAMGRLLPAPFEPRRTLVAIEWLSRF
jgi:hypothetical protein